MTNKPLILLACAALFAGAAHAAQPIAIEDLAKVPMIQSPSMSIDGKQIVAIVAAPGSNNQDTALATWNLADMDESAVVTPSGDRMKFVRASALKADRMLVIGRQEWTGQLGGCGEGSVSGATKTFVSKVYLTDATHSKFSDAFADNTRRIGVSEQMQRCLDIAGTASLVHPLPLDPDHVLVQQMNELTLSANIYKYNLRTGATELMLRAGGRTSPGLFHPRTGEAITRVELAAAGNDEYEYKISIRNKTSGEFEEHSELTQRLSERYTLEVVGIDEQSGKLYIITDKFSDLAQARMYDPATRRFDPEPLVTHPRFPISSLIFGISQKDFNQVLGFTYDGLVREQVFVDPELKSIQAGLAQAFPDQQVLIGDSNDDRSRILFTTSSNRHPPSYHLLIDRKQVKPLGEQRPGFDASGVGEQSLVTYKARDGRDIPAILDLPAGWKKGDAPLPTIIHPHGGPWARDYGGWDGSGWVPFLTSRGYAVLRPQYRGSTGFGRDHWLAGDKQWGLRMQDDKDDGAAWLVSEGIAAKDRIAIFGYSYGGFAAAAAVVRQNSPYQCALSGAPVTDLARLGTTWSDSRIQRILQADTVTGMDPMRHTASAGIPVLLYVGDRDVRTPAFHARGFYNAVKDKVDARFELVADMPHSMPWYPRHHRDTLGMIEDFFKNECGPGGL